LNQIEIKRGSAKFLMGISNPSQLAEFCQQNPLIIGLAFVGRSNVGKSSCINALFGNNTARVSNTPGRTREVNIFSFELTNLETQTQFFLFDLPGYGHASVSKAMTKNWNDLMSIFFEYLSIRIALINLQDARHPNTEADKMFHKFLKYFDNDTILVLNKLDKLKKQKERAELKKLMPSIYKQYKWVSQINQVSAETGLGIKELEQNLVSFLLKKWQLVHESELV
jgi:GTP-binding protein